MLNQIIHRFNIDVESVKGVEDSFSSSVYKCTLADGDHVYVKIPYSSLKLKRELEAYELLAGRISTPRLLDHWEGDEHCVGALLLSELKGTPLSVHSNQEVAFQVGVLHAKMHAISPSPGRTSTRIKNEFPNWSQFIEYQFYSFAEDVRQVMDERVYRRAIHRFEHMKQSLPAPDGPSFVHMDFRPANIIVDDEQVSGVIDFESVRFGSTEIDFTKLYRDYLQHDDAITLAYQEGYNSIRPLTDFDLILPFYRFTDAFNSIGWCHRRGLEQHAHFFTKNLNLLKEWL